MTTFAVSTEVDAETARFIGEGLNGYNYQAGGPHNDQDLWVVARDESGAVIGGLKGSSEYSWLFVEWLWVDAAARKRGLGIQLLGKAEEVARQRGCIGVHLDSYTFQAPEFYKRQGYEEFGRIDDYPPGHSRVWLKKRL
ncbi:GNAT family N-acetyltransferase [Aminobacter sp. HY435]|uniref:GNAT family N-acetyltransferase n=1 Tax=Aminobacter sp. HY435 TaxID=2970917 RepID=UPI0022B99F71|nr:GNAT family N-acetyltransferase [Aminobacter sp. HY435]